MLYGVSSFHASPHVVDPEEQGCGAPDGPAYWAARVRVCTGCIKKWYPLLSDPVCWSLDVKP